MKHHAFSVLYKHGADGIAGGLRTGQHANCD